MWAKRSFKAARILVTVMLAIASTLIFVRSDGGRLIYARHVQTEPPKGVQAPPTNMTDAQKPASVIEKRPSAVAVEKKTQTPPPGQFVDQTQGDAGEVTTGTAREKTTGMTTGTASGPSSATTTGTAGQTVGSAKGSPTSTTTGAAGPIPAATAGAVVLAYDGQPADARLKLVLSDLRSDLRRSIVEVIRGPPKSALQNALDALGRSQDRADLLVDIARDADLGSKGGSQRSGQADSPDNHATTGTGFMKVAEAADGAPTGMVSGKKDGSPWLEPGVLISIAGLLIALVIAWFGDNLSERMFGRRRVDIQLAGNVPAALPVPDVPGQIEQQPASS